MPVASGMNRRTAGTAPPSAKRETIEYYDRRTGQLCRETVMGDAAIRWAYQTLSGRVFSPALFGASLLSRMLGWYFDSSLSRKKIARTISDLGIDESEFARSPDAFCSFNDFFTRRLKDGARPFSADADCLLSPADGRVLVYDDLSGDTGVQVKGVEDTLDRLFDRAMGDFNDGKVAVVRLCPADYHRFHFPCDGTVIEQVAIKGKFHSVNPIALASRKRIFCLNKRSYTLMDTERFGRIAYMEVGAFGVAGIHQTFSGTQIRRMQEKGYFDFGGSTIVLVFAKDTIEFESDLRKNSLEGVETLVKVGQTIARAVRAC